MAYTFDKDQFSSILRKILFQYNSITELANEANWDRTYMSKYIHKRISTPPLPSKLQTLAKASKGITNYNELMYICGYIEKENFLFNKQYDILFSNIESNLHSIGLNNEQILTLKEIFINNNSNYNIILEKSLNFSETFEKNIREVFNKYYTRFLKNFFNTPVATNSFLLETIYKKLQTLEKNELEKINEYIDFIILQKKKK